MAACEATGSVPVAVDGESARAPKRDTATGCLHVVTAWAAEDRLVLGAAAVRYGSNEVAAIPVLLRTLDLAGAIVTIDAAGCQVENARIIREQQGHYPLAVKDNQPTLRAGVEAVIGRACVADFAGVRCDTFSAPLYRMLPRLAVVGDASCNWWRCRRRRRFTA